MDQESNLGSYKKINSNRKEGNNKVEKTLKEKKKQNKYNSKVNQLLASLMKTSES